MPVYHKFTIGGSVIKGTRIADDGAVKEFNGSLRNFYSGADRYAKASLAARRKYKDNTITINSVKSEKHQYRVDLDDLLKIATEI